MIRIKQEPDALDLTNQPRHLLSPTHEHEDDDEDNFSGEDDTHDCLPKVLQKIIFTFNFNSFFFFRNQYMIAVLLIQVMRIIIAQLWLNKVG